MATDTADLRRLAFNLFSLVATPVALYYAASWLFETLDPLKSRNDAAKKQSARTVQRLQKSLKDANIRLKDITEHETVIMSEVITPDELNVKFDGIVIHTTKLTRTDIGGLEDIISSVKETVIYPLVYPDLFQSASYFHFEICLMIGGY
jgi:SpoVK/Ycf46/Vps4 family AAA+-type ATPase